MAKKKLKEDAEGLVQNIVFGKAGDMKQIFDDILKGKIADRVKEHEAEVAANLFAGKEKTEEPEEEIEDSEEELEDEEYSEEELEFLDSLTDEEIEEILNSETEEDNDEGEDDSEESEEA